MASKVAKRKAGKKLKRNTWKENEVLPFCHRFVFFRRERQTLGIYSRNVSPEEDCNERIFIKILEEFDDILAKKGKEKDENYQFTVAQLRAITRG